MFQVILRVVIGSLAHLMALKGWVELMFQIQLLQNSILMICVALVKLFKLLIYQCLVFLELLHMIYSVFKLDLSETKHLLGHQKCTFKS